MQHCYRKISEESFPSSSSSSAAYTCKNHQTVLWWEQSGNFTIDPAVGVFDGWVNCGRSYWWATDSTIWYSTTVSPWFLGFSLVIMSSEQQVVLLKPTHSSNRYISPLLCIFVTVHLNHSRIIRDEPTPVFTLLNPIRNCSGTPYIALKTVQRNWLLMQAMPDSNL